MKKKNAKSIEKQIAASLVMGAMRKEENITADEKDITANIAALKRRYPDRTDAELWEPAEAIAMQKKLFDILEGEKNGHETFCDSSRVRTMIEKSWNPTKLLGRKRLSRTVWTTRRRCWRSLAARTDAEAERMKRYLAMPDLSRTPGSPLYEIVEKARQVPVMQGFR